MKNVVVLIITLLLCFGVAEAGLRIYAASTGVIIAPNEYDHAQQELYRQLTNESDEDRFLYGRNERWTHDPLLGIVPTPNHLEAANVSFPVNTTHNTTVTIVRDYINEYGMASTHEITNKTRIALLGDSFTMGGDVLPSFSFANLLPELADADFLNFGVDGKGTDFMYAIYKERAETFEPDIIVLNIFIDDLTRNGYGNEMFYQPQLSLENGSLALMEKNIPTYDEFLETYKPRKRSYIVDWIKGKMNNINKRNKLYEYGLEKLPFILDELSETPLLVTIFTSTEDLDPDYERSIEMYQRVITLLEEKNIPYLDGNRLFSDVLPPDANITTTFFSPERSGHFNEVGNAVFAQGIAEKLDQFNIVLTRTDSISYTPNRITLRFFHEGEEVVTVQGYDIERFT